MKSIKIIFIALFVLTSSSMVNAQTADEIIDNYFENTGGKKAWSQLSGAKMTASINQQGLEIPITIYQMTDGKQLVNANIQGQEFTQTAYDGKVLWSTNFLTQQAEKADAEATENAKAQFEGSFPSPFLNYKDKGFSVELIGKETFDGAETYKIKLTQKPIKVNGVEKANISFYYFDVDSFAVIGLENEITQGPQAGTMGKTTMSDYEEVDGLFFPFSMNFGGQAIKLDKIELNPEVDNSLFAFPEGK